MNGASGFKIILFFSTFYFSCPLYSDIHTYSTKIFQISVSAVGAVGKTVNLSDHRLGISEKIIKNF
ncbi:hypothetical protein CLOSTASPAR_03850 [[Clostridium] asparagiforme DSM 15981]|uniref:Uncharacterized protein n=1 Tax=[Clostridium] asparagiforme DSM 15981 TaxID=518636 RepID=C0D3K9_9FIRM|nr:hypothetical protein CLOSTASPAR_03850 [[Clostridium] asparagiforme DSM 15981]